MTQPPRFDVAALEGGIKVIVDDRLPEGMWYLVQPVEVEHYSLLTGEAVYATTRPAPLLLAATKAAAMARAIIAGGSPQEAARALTELSGGNEGAEKP